MVLVFCVFSPLAASAQFVQSSGDAFSAPPVQNAREVAVPPAAGGSSSSNAVPATLPPEEELLRLREQERALLEYFGPDYYQVQDIRARMKAIGDFIALKQKDLGRAESFRGAESAPAGTEVSSGRSPQAGKTSAADAGCVDYGKVCSGRAPSDGKTPAVGNEEPIRIVPAQAPEGQGAASREVPATAGTTHAHVPAAHEDKEAGEWQGRSGAFLATLTFAVIVGLSVGLAIQFAILLWLLHRFAGRSNALIRLDRANPSSIPSGQSVENRASGAWDSRGIAASGNSAQNQLLVARIQTTRPRALSEQATLPGTRDDLGDALVQELCQQNVWLREQIDQLETVTA